MNTSPAPQPRPYSDTLFLAVFGLAFAVGTVLLLQGMTDLVQALGSLSDTLSSLTAAKNL